MPKMSSTYCRRRVSRKSAPRRMTKAAEYYRVHYFEPKVGEWKQAGGVQKVKKTQLKVVYIRRGAGGGVVFYVVDDVVWSFPAL